MKSIKFITLMATILVLASCGQSRFTQKKYLNLKPIEEVKPEQENTKTAYEEEKRQGEVVEEKTEKEVLLEESSSAKDNETTQTENTDAVDQKQRKTDDKASTKAKIKRILNEKGSNGKVIFPHQKKAADEGDDPGMKPIVRDGIILSVIEVVLFISMIVFIVLAFAFFDIPFLVGLAVVGGIALLMIAVGIIAIIKGKKGLDSGDKTALNIIFSIALIVVGGIGIIASIIASVNYAWTGVF